MKLRLIKFVNMYIIYYIKCLLIFAYFASTIPEQSLFEV